MRASKAAGPLAIWVKSIVEYADIYLKIEPLRNEVAGLEQEKEKMEIEMNEVQAKLIELTNQIDQLKQEYGELIARV